MPKCSYHSCQKELSVEKREVYAIRIKTIQRDEQGEPVLNDKGKRISIWEGWRFFCKDHHDFIKGKKIFPSLSLVYGPKKGKKRGYKKHDKRRAGVFSRRANEGATGKGRRNRGPQSNDRRRLRGFERPQGSTGSSQNPGGGKQGS